MSRKGLAAIVAVALAGALLQLGTSSPVEAQGATAPILGAYAQPVGNESNIDAIVKLERTLGTTLPMVRAYSDWDDTIGPEKPLHKWTKDGGRDLFLSIKPQRQNGQVVTWQQVANAQPGSQVYREMQALARGVRSYGSPMIFGFHHEPEQNENQKFGTSDDFRAAYRKVHAVFTAEGATNVQWAWIMTEWAFEVETIRPNDRRVADRWYPGDDVVDLISSDTYNWNNCRGNTTDPWRTLEDDLAPLMRFLAKHPGKKLTLGEFGSDEGTPGQKAEWMNEAQALFKRAPYRDAFVALLYFHDDGAVDGVPNCDWWLDTSTSSTNAAGTWFLDPAYRTRLLGATSESCNGRPATIVGTSGADTLIGTAGDDVIVGLGGNDTIRGLGGNDVICGGTGNDRLFGGGGADTLHGDAGRDLILGGYGPDVARGGPGPDRMNGQHGNDVFAGEGGEDTIRGGPHQDRLFGGSHADTILGQGGWDIIYGDGGSDTLSGGVGADTIIGGTGNNRCNGNEGNNVIDC